jgi:hypothetical protein
MDIRIHTGGHNATTDHLLKALKENSDVLANENIHYFPTDIDTFTAIFKASKAIRNGAVAKPTAIELMEKLTGVRDAQKLLIIDNRVIGQKHRLFEKELFYPRNSGIINQIKTIFSDYNIRLFLETRSFTSLIPSYYSDTVFHNMASNYDDFIAQINLEDLQWSSLIERSQGRGTPLPATAWRYEDYPYIWRDIIGAITGIKKYQDLNAPAENLDLDVDLQRALLFNKYIQKHPDQTSEEFEKMKMLFLQQDLSAVKKLDIPDWSQERTEALQHGYDDDWYYIERMDDVETILPRKLA